MTDIFLAERAGGRPASEVYADELEPSFSELFDAHFHSLVRLAGLLGADDPEDIAQDAFARFHRKRRRLRDERAAFAYLRSTVCNLTRNRHRHLRIARLRLPSVRDRSTTGDEEPPAEATVIDREDHRALLTALERLPTRQREVLVLRYWLDLSEREIAEALGVSAGTVKSHAHRGIAALKLDLGEDS